MRGAAMTLLTVEEAANRISVHPETIRRMIRRGELSALKVGPTYRVDPYDLVPKRFEVEPRAPRPDDSPLAGVVRAELLRRGIGA